MCEEVLHTKGLIGFLALWIEVGLDTIKSAFEIYLKLHLTPSLEKLTLLGSATGILMCSVSILFAFTQASTDWVYWTFRIRWIWLSLGLLALFPLMGYAALCSLDKVNLSIGFWLSSVAALLMFVIGINMPAKIQFWRMYTNALDVLALGLLIHAFAEFRSHRARTWGYIFASLGLFTFLTNYFSPAKNMSKLFPGDETLFALSMGLAWLVFALALRQKKAG